MVTSSTESHNKYSQMLILPLLNVYFAVLLTGEKWHWQVTGEASYDLINYLLSTHSNLLFKRYIYTYILYSYKEKPNTFKICNFIIKEKNLFINTIIPPQTHLSVTCLVVCCHYFLTRLGNDPWQHSTQYEQYYYATKWSECPPMHY